MAGSSRLSISTIMVVVLFVAANCATLRVVGDEWILILMPTLDILVLGLFRVIHLPETRRFWIPVETLGWPLLGLLAVGMWKSPDLIVIPGAWLMSNHRWLAGSSPIAVIFCYFMIMTLYTIPILLPPAILGWFWDRYQVIIVRRNMEWMPQSELIEAHV